MMKYNVMLSVKLSPFWKDIVVASFISLVLARQVATRMEPRAASLEGKHEKKGGIAAPPWSH